MNNINNDEELLNARLEVPSHVVHRSFAAETVVLNLQSGKYHGLNPVAGRMLEAINSGRTIREAAQTVAANYGEDLDSVTQHMLSLCRGLLERGLVADLDGDGP